MAAVGGAIAGGTGWNTYVATDDVDATTRGCTELGAAVIGALVPFEPGQSPHWHGTFTVSDRDDAAATAERLGATVLEQHESAWTRRATIRDPQGAVFTTSQFTPPAP